MNVTAHLLKAKRNKKILSKYLMQIIDKCPDWVAVVAFYTALHFVEAFLKRNHGINFKRHEERHTFMSEHVREIYPAYYRLYDLGFKARYKSIKDAPNFDDADSAVKYDLADVEKFVIERLN